MTCGGAIAAGITVIRAIMDKEAGHIVETAVEARAALLIDRRPSC